jgi:prolyl-tRNA editing enzyme YbaK/EbsC (Cys-tRNA(Pro) deacylase)
MSESADDLSHHPSVTRVRQALTGLAAEQLGVPVGAIANSLLFAIEENGQLRPLLVLASGAHRVDTDKLAGELGVERIAKATPEFVRTHTGFAIGGVAPVGHLHPITTLVDVTLARHPRVWAAGGHPRTVFATHYDELLRITAGRATEVN